MQRWIWIAAAWAVLSAAFPPAAVALPLCNSHHRCGPPVVVTHCDGNHVLVNNTSCSRLVRRTRITMRRALACRTTPAYRRGFGCTAIVFGGDKKPARRFSPAKELVKHSNPDAPD